MVDLNKNSSFDALFTQWQEAHCAEPNTSYLEPNIPIDIEELKKRNRKDGTAE